MTKAIEHKKVLVNALAQEIQNTKTFIVFEYHKLTVAHLNEIRDALAEVDGKLVVHKNSLIRFATAFVNNDELANVLTGPNAFVYCNAEAPVVAKLLYKFSKKYKSLRLKAALLAQKFVNETELVQIATLPTREELLAMFASSLLYPLRSFAIGVKALAAQKEQATQTT